jgi:hypothetical protein
MVMLRNAVVGLSVGAVLVAAACSGVGAYADGGVGSGAGTTASGASTSAGNGASTTSANGASSTTSGTTTTTPCPAMCNGACADTQTDPANCGQCGVACAAGYTCLAGTCGNVVIDASTFLATCAVLKAGEVWCWGRDVYGEIGVPSTYAGNVTCPSGDQCLVTPNKVAGVSNAVQVVAGRQATCVLTSTHDVWCWGLNNSGQISSPPTAGIVGAPVKNANVVGNADQVVVSTDEAATANAVCVRRTTTHEVDCWGAGGNTLFPATANHTLCSAGGDDYCTPHATPVPMVFSQSAGPLVTADDLSIGVGVGIALQGTSVFTWGINNFGQGSASSPSGSFNPRQIFTTTPGSAVSALGVTTALIATDGTVYTLGWADDGALGNDVHGTAAGLCPLMDGQGCANAPVHIPAASLSGVTKVASGLFGSVAITGAGKLYAWVCRARRRRPASSAPRAGRRSPGAATWRSPRRSRGWRRRSSARTGVPIW